MHQLNAEITTAARQ